MSKWLPFFFLIFFPLFLQAQRHDNVTLLGYYGGIVSPPNDDLGISVLTFPEGSLHIEQNFDLSIYFDVTNSIISDSLGVLQAYTNGGDIGNSAWQYIENGTNLTDDGPGPNLWPQIALLMPKPESKDKLILFYGDEEFYMFFGIDTVLWIASKDLKWAEINMSLNSGLGRVTSINNVVLNDTLGIGKFTACKHANGRDWWILAHEQESNRYYRVLLDPEGPHLVGVQAVGNKYQDGYGQACFSPDGSKYVVIDGVDLDTTTVVGTHTNVYDFDRCTGLLSNHRYINEPQGAWAGGAISPNSRYFYASFNTYALQYDLWADDIAASAIKVMEYDGYQSPYPTWSMFHQRMPDDRIYGCTFSLSTALHAIQRPDEPGLNCRYEQHAIHLPTRNSYTVPNFPYFRLGPLDGSPCDTLGLDNIPVAWWRYELDTLQPLWVEFRDLSYYEPATWLWNFGDGHTSTERHPVHEYDSAGVYQVCLTVTNTHGSDTHCKTLYMGVSAQENPVLQSQIQVTPNPFTDRLMVSLSASLRSPVFRLYDQTGRLVLQERLLFGVNEIDTGNLPKGMYFWTVVGATVGAGFTPALIPNTQSPIKSGKCVKM